MSFLECASHHRQFLYFCLKCNKCACEECKCARSHHIIDLLQFLNETQGSIVEEFRTISGMLDQEITACNEDQEKVDETRETLYSMLENVEDKPIEGELDTLRQEMCQTKDSLSMRENAVRKLQGLKEWGIEERFALYILEKERPETPFIPRKELVKKIQKMKKIISRLERDVRARAKEIGMLRNTIRYTSVVCCDGAMCVTVPPCSKAVTYFTKGDKTEILVIQRNVEIIAKDALLSLPSLRAIVLDKDSKIRPEACNFWKEGEIYKHIPVFRVDTVNPPLISLPDAVFRTGYDIPVLMYSEEEKSIDVCGQTLTCNGGYCIRYMKFDTKCSFSIEEVGGIEVIEWSNARNYGVVGETLVIPYGVYSVEKDQYRGNNSMISVYIPATMKVVGERAFYQCSNLRNIEFMYGVREIRGNAFNKTKITNFSVPGSVTVIGEGAFSSTPLSSIIFEKESMLESIGDWTFANTNLSTITFPPSVQLFGYNMFDNTPITHICAPGTAKFHNLFLDGIKTKCIICFYNCRRAPEIDYYNITVEKRKDNPLME